MLILVAFSIPEGPTKHSRVFRAFSKVQKCTIVLNLVVFTSKLAICEEEEEEERDSGSGKLTIYVLLKRFSHNLLFCTLTNILATVCYFRVFMH